MKEKCSELLASIKQAFSSKEGLIVVITIFTVAFFVTLIELDFSSHLYENKHLLAYFQHK